MCCDAKTVSDRIIKIKQTDKFKFEPLIRMQLNRIMCNSIFTFSATFHPSYDNDRSHIIIKKQTKYKKKEL